MSAMLLSTAQCSVIAAPVAPPATPHAALKTEATQMRRKKRPPSRKAGRGASISRARPMSFEASANSRQVCKTKNRVGSVREEGEIGSVSGVVSGVVSVGFHSLPRTWWEYSDVHFVYSCAMIETSVTPTLPPNKRSGILNDESEGVIVLTPFGDQPARPRHADEKIYLARRCTQ